MARIKEAAKVTGFSAKDAAKTATIMESMGSADKKQKTKYHAELKQIYQDNWEWLKSHNQSLQPVSVKTQPKVRRNKGPYARETSVS